jgi:hypothetical protein
VEKTSRFRSRDLVASGVKCGPHGGKNGKMKSVDGSWLSHKTKVEPGLRGSQDMSGGWRRLHQVRGVWVVHQKITGLLGRATKPRPKTGCGCLAKTGVTGFENRSDWFGVAGRRKLRGGGHASGSQGLRRGYAKCGCRASVRWCYEDKFPKCPWWACILV